MKILFGLSGDEMQVDFDRETKEFDDGHFITTDFSEMIKHLESELEAENREAE